MSTSELIQFAPTPKNLPAQVDQLDKAGETILQLVHEAAGVAEQNSSRVLRMAQKFSDQLRTAEDRIAELEAESATYRERGDRAEQWLHTVYTEIEDRFFSARRLSPRACLKAGCSRTQRGRLPSSEYDELPTDCATAAIIAS
jgi:hypothetical protein